LPWFAGKDGMENIYNGLLKHGFNESDAGKVIGQNWFGFLEQGLKPLA
jgi:microsomal dipeptidase-like Zn-dependent dipeptidase